MTQKSKMKQAGACRFYDFVDADDAHIVVRFPKSGGRAAAKIFQRVRKLAPRDLFLEVYSAGGDIDAEFNDGKPWQNLCERFKPAEFCVCNVGGWHGRQFLTRNHYYGSGKALIHVSAFDSTRPAPIDEKGRLLRPKHQKDEFKALREVVSKIGAQSNYATFAVGAGLAGILLKLAGFKESVGFAFIGKSGSGKTSMLVMASALHQSTSAGDLPKFSDTRRRREEQNFAVNDATMVIDEMTPKTPEDYGELRNIAMMANGGGRRRAGAIATGNDYPDLKWQNVVLGAGESMNDSGRELGERRRLIVLKLPKNGAGIFDRPNAPSSTRRSDLLREMDKLAAQQSGYAFELFAKQVVRRQDALRANLPRFLRRFVALAAQKETLSDFERLVAERFALIAAACQLAAGVGILTIPRNIATMAPLRLFHRWLQEERRFAPETWDAVRFSERVKELSQDLSRMPPVDKVKSGQLGPRRIYGFQSKEGGTRYIYVDKLKIGLAFRNIDLKTASALSKATDLLKPGSSKSIYSDRQVIGYPGRSRGTFLALRVPRRMN